MRVHTRPVEAEAVQYLYPSTTAHVADYFGGLVDVDGHLWLSTKSGVVQVDLPCWIVRDDDGIEVLTDTQTLTRYLPDDPNEGYRVLGGRSWPTAAQVA